MQERDTFGILYYFIISQFSTARPRSSPPGLIPLPHSPLKHHLHVYLCISLPAVISQPGYGVGKTNYASDDPILSFYCIALLRKNPAIYRTDARGAACDPAAVTTQPRTIDKRPRRGSRLFPHSNVSLTSCFHFKDSRSFSLWQNAHELMWEMIVGSTYSRVFQNWTFVFILEEDRAIIKLEEMNVSRLLYAGALRRLCGPPLRCYTSLLTRR